MSNNGRPFLRLEGKTETCSIPKCEKHEITKGYCQHHYQRLHQTGSLQTIVGKLEQDYLETRKLIEKEFL